MTPFSFSLRPPRHPLLRAALALSGLLLLGVFAAFGLAIAALVLLAFGVRRLLLASHGVARPLRDRTAPAVDAPVDGAVIDGEYSVIRKPHGRLLPR